MKAFKTKFHCLIAVLAALPSLVGVAPAFAQSDPVGTMSYGPGIATAVPLGGGAFLVILGVLLGALAYRRISRNGPGASASASITLAIGAIVFTASGGQMLHQAYAAMAPTALSNPQGGVVDVFPGYQEYENTSGAPLKINAINLDECPSSPVEVQAEPAIPACIPGSTVLENGGICSTNYPPCDLGDRVTFQAGYFWVRATYPASLNDHDDICAEFDLVATEEEVSLTWDETLLQSISTAFGYSSNGQDGCCAPAMWCWDGDGGGSTPSGGLCGTHSFGSIYTNYGTYTDDPDERPVFTCVEPL